MSLTLFSHPLASFCHKVLIALYEMDIRFEHRIVDFADPEDAKAYLDMWPVGKIPLLKDGETLVPETSVIIEYLCEHHAGGTSMLPADPAQRLDVRLWDRFFDIYVQQPMQKIVGDRLRPENARDPHGVAEARAALPVAYAMIERQMTGRQWAVGDAFTMADCAAVPALFYAGILVPFENDYPDVSAYFERLLARPSVQRVLDEARPWYPNFPFFDDMPKRFLEDAHAAAS